MARKSTRAHESSEEIVSDSVEEISPEEFHDAASDDDVLSLHSDALDDDKTNKRPATRKRKRASPEKPSPKKNSGNGKPSSSKEASSSSSPTKKGPANSKKASPKKNVSPRKKQKRSESDDDGGSGEEYEGIDLKDGQEVVGRVVQAPKTGRVPPGQISQNTLDFLTRLKDPACNDREWFKLHEPVYRLAEKEFKDFIEEFTNVLTEVDPQIPPLPPKDVIHRIYRDIRFSNDKTPYKRGLSATFSRSGRKGIFAGLKPGGESLVAAGSWCPNKNELATIRTHISQNSSRLRKIITSKDFVKYFGPAKPHPQGKRQNVFGSEDELKVAPKGFDKNHKDIDLLKCRSFAVFHTFPDERVLAPDFTEDLRKVTDVLKPFVHCLNDMMTVEAQNNEEEDGEDGDDEH